jgi:hypothetical protein
MCGDPEVTRYLLMRFSREQSWRHLAFLVGHWKLRGYGMWAVEEKETGTFVGRIGFADPEGLAGLRAGMDPDAALVGARLRHRRRPGRPGLRLHRAGQKTASSASSTRRTAPPAAWPNASAGACGTAPRFWGTSTSSTVSTGKATPGLDGLIRARGRHKRPAVLMQEEARWPHRPRVWSAQLLLTCP